MAAFNRAIELAPAFARPYGDLALALQSGRVMDRVSYEEAREAAEAAFAIDPQLAEAHAALGIVALEEGRLADADAALRRALVLNPTLVIAHAWLSVNLQAQGRYAESARVLERALELDPLNPELNARLAAQHWARGDYEGARRLYVRILDLPKPPAAPYYMLVSLNREFGRLEEALAWAQQAALEFPKFAGLNALIQTYARLDMREEAETWVERLGRVEGDAAPRLGIHSEYLFTQGRFEEIYALKTEYLRRSGLALSDLPFAVQETFGGVQILTGRYAEGIRTLEPWFGDDFRLPHHLGGSDFALTFAQFLAWGYRQAGNAAAAERLLDRIGQHLEDMRAAGVGERPNLYVVEARNHALRNENAAALAALGKAVEMGWRDYVFEHANPVWGALRDDPGFAALMDRVRADVAAQRARIEARADARAFEPAVLARLGL